MARVMRIKRVQPSTWEETLEQYLLWKQAQGLRDITVKGHRDVIGLLYRRYPEAWCENPKEAVYRFMGESIKPATYNIRRNYLRQFFEWRYTRAPSLRIHWMDSESAKMKVESSALTRIPLPSY